LATAGCHTHTSTHPDKHTHAIAPTPQVQSLAPKVEAMEASWNRIRTISGAETAEDVIMYWEGLKAKEEQVGWHVGGGWS